MSDEQVIRKGQVWVSKDGKRTVRITKYDATWSDCCWVNVKTGGRGDIYAGNLRARYTLEEDS